MPRNKVTTGEFAAWSGFGPQPTRRQGYGGPTALFGRRWRATDPGVLPGSPRSRQSRGPHGGRCGVQARSETVCSDWSGSSRSGRSHIHHDDDGPAALFGS